MDWFLESSAGHDQGTGEPIPLGSVEAGDSIIMPSGAKIALQQGAGYFSGTFQQGIYRRIRGAGTQLFARNLDDLGESDLRKSAPIELRGQTAGATGSPSVLFSFWPYLLMVTLLLFLLEWFAFPRSAPANFGFSAIRTLPLRR